MGKKILVVDDDPNICELVSLALSAKGFNVKVAQTGEDGVKDVDEFAPDVILLDMTLPDMDGTEAARKMKGSAAGKKASILMMSGRDTMDIDGTLFAGKLLKPFSLAKLAEEAGKYAGDHHI